MEKNKELREIILGSNLLENDVLVYYKRSPRVFQYVNINWLFSRLFGPVHMKHRLSFDKKRLDRMSAGVYDTLENMGRLVYLESEPQVLSVYYKKWWSEPIIISAKRDSANRVLELTGTTYRGLFSRLILFYSLVKLEKEIPYLKERLPKERKVKVKKAKQKREKKKKK